MRDDLAGFVDAGSLEIGLPSHLPREVTGGLVGSAFDRPSVAEASASGDVEVQALGRIAAN